MDKKYEYVLLEEGEIIQEGDEWLDIDDGVYLIWKKTLDAGKQVMSGIYRRRIEVETTPQESNNVLWRGILWYDIDEQGNSVVKVEEVLNCLDAGTLRQAKERAEAVCVAKSTNVHVFECVGRVDYLAKPFEWTWTGDA